MNLLRTCIAAILIVSFCQAWAQTEAIDPGAKAALDKYIARRGAATTVQGHSVLIGGYGPDPEHTTFKFKRPGCFSTTEDTTQIVDDGHKTTLVFLDTRTYKSEPAGTEKPYFLEGLLLDRNPAFTSVTFDRFDGRRAVHAVYHRLDVTNPQKVDYWIDPDRLIPLAFSISSNRRNKSPRVILTRYDSVIFDAPLTVARDFTPKIPREYAFIPPPPKLLSVGVEAPQITLRDSEGRSVILADVIKNHKGVVVNFWFVDCPFCQEEFPHLEQIYEKLKSQGLEVLAIDRGLDKPADVAKFMSDKKLSFTALINDMKSKDDAVKAYHVSLFPTNYLISSDGRISASVLGFAGDLSVKEMESGLKKLGFQF